MTNTHITHEVSVQEGYARWAAQYDRESNALIKIKDGAKPFCQVILAAKSTDE